jgi:hypothetical protein
MRKLEHEKLLDQRKPKQGKYLPIEKNDQEEIGSENAENLLNLQNAEKRALN